MAHAVRTASMLFALVGAGQVGGVGSAPVAVYHGPRAVCTAADNRIKASDPATARLSNHLQGLDAVCTGFLIDRAPADDPGDRCMLSAGHCFFGPDLEVAEFEPLEPTTYDAGAGICIRTLSPPDRQFAIDKDLTTGHFIRRPNTLPTGGDYAVFRLRRNAVTGLSAYEQQAAAWRFAAAFVVPFPAVKYGYGSLGSPDGSEPAGPDFGPCTCRAGDPRMPMSFRQTQGFGTLTPGTGNQLEYDIHTCAGDSGAPIVIGGLGVVGVHSGFRIKLDGVTSGCGFDAVAGRGVPFNAGTRIFDQMRADIGRVCPLDPQADTYLCYAAHDRRPAQNPPDVRMRDQFYDAEYDVKKARLLCTPTERSGSPMVDPAVHLKRYDLERKTSGEPPVATVLVRNQLGDVTIAVKRESDLAMPTAKNPGAPPPPLEPGTPGFQPYKCYKVKKIHTPFTEVPLTLQDQFGTVQLTVGKPVRLCNPVAILGQGIAADAVVEPDRHLLCYKIDGDFSRPPGVFVNNDFGPEELALGKPKQLCVPSAKIPIVCGDGFCDPPETADEQDGCPADCG